MRSLAVFATRKHLCGLLLAFALAGCSALKPEENVIFFTKTSFGLDVDGTPPEATLAYGRQEGFMGPRYESGAVPPVASYMSTNGTLLARSIKQFYATGNAALALTSDATQPTSPPLKGAKKAMYFGTGTTTGIKLGFNATGAEGLVIGYRRKELSYIPVGTSADGDTYASVIGVYTNEVSAARAEGTGLGIAQYFATGGAAERIAAQTVTRDAFRRKGSDAFEDYRGGINAQDHEVIQVLRCFAYVDDSKVEMILQDAHDKKLLQDDAALASIQKVSDMKKRRAAYIDEIGISSGRNLDRSQRLVDHRSIVCDPGMRLAS